MQLIARSYLVCRPGRQRRVPLHYLRIVLLAHQAAVDQPEAVPGHKGAPARDAREALDVVHMRLRAHHHLVGGDVLTAGHARPNRAEQSETDRTVEGKGQQKVEGWAQDDQYVSDLSLFPTTTTTE